MAHEKGAPVRIIHNADEDIPEEAVGAIAEITDVIEITETSHLYTFESDGKEYVLTSDQVETPDQLEIAEAIGA